MAKDTYSSYPTEFTMDMTSRFAALHKKFIDSITQCIDAKYLTIISRETYETYNPSLPAQDMNDEWKISDGEELNGTVMDELISVLPGDAKQLADITDEIDRIMSFRTKEFHGDSCSSCWCDDSLDVGVSNVYHQTFGDVGTLHLYLSYSVMSSGYSCYNYTHEYVTTVTIPNVVYKNHKYYFMTIPLYKWLREDGKEKRRKYLAQITYGSV